MITIHPLSVGPIVGHTDTDHVRIWGRAEHEPEASGRPRRTFGIARLRERGQSTYESPIFFKMNPNFDISGIVIFHGLTSDSTYEYQIGYFYSDKELYELSPNSDWNWHYASEGECRTTHTDPNQDRSVVFGSCRYLLKLFGGTWFDSRGDKTFRSINRQIEKGKTVDKFLMIGDQIYADDLNFVDPDKHVDEFLARYRDAFTQPHIRQLMSRVSTNMTLDDHEIEDNWPSNANCRDKMRKYPAAMHAYQIYQVSHSSLIPLDKNGRMAGTPTHFYYTFKDGCCDFFVTDTRTERNVEEKEMLSEEQLHALLDWLGDDSGLVKLVATSVPFFPDTKKGGEDKWKGFQYQRDEIIQFIKKHNIEKVVFLSGDVHCSFAAELDISDDGEPKHCIHSVVSSAFYWPYPHMKRKEFKLSGHIASEHHHQAYRLTRVSKVYSGDNFTRMRISQKDLEVEVYERKGDLVHRIDFSF